MGRRSGPDAFEGFKLLSSFSMPGTVNNMSVWHWGDRVFVYFSGSLVNCDGYWAFGASAFSCESLLMPLSGFSTGILLCPDFFCLMYM